MKNIAIWLLLLLGTHCYSEGNKINASISFAAARSISLKIFQGLTETVIDSGMTDQTGTVILKYPDSYQGVGVLSIEGQASVILILNNEDFGLTWVEPSPDGLRFENSVENSAFSSISQLAIDADKRLSALKFLVPLYESGSKESSWLKSQIESQANVLPIAMSGVDNTRYCKYYLNLVNIVNAMQDDLKTGQVSTSQEMERLENLTILDRRMLHSGLLSTLLDLHYRTLSTLPNDSMYKYYNESTSIILKKVENDVMLKQDVAEYLFQMFEKRSEFISAEFLAKAMLSDSNCVNDGRREALFQQYGRMGVGSIAPDFELPNSTRSSQRLSDVENHYKLVVFGSSWCPKCAKEIPGLTKFYSNWKKERDVEIVLVSLDTDPIAYKKFVADFPWISSCDFNGWESRTAREYFIMATPTMYLLDKDNKILLKPVSAEHLEAWLKVPGRM